MSSGIIQTIIQTSDLFFEITANQTNLDIKTLVGDILYNAAYRKRVIIPAAVTVGSATTATAAVTIPTGLGGSLFIDNYGSIQGAGGIAGVGNGIGGDAILAQSTCTIENKPTGTIYAGGGAGGTGGTGGQGGPGQVVNSPYTLYRWTCFPAPICPTQLNCGSVTWPGGPVTTTFGGCFIVPTVCTQPLRGRRCDDTYNPNPTPTIGGGGGTGGAGGNGRGYNQAPTSGILGSSGLAGGTNAGTGGSGGQGGTGGDWGTQGNTGATGATGANGNVGSGLAGSVGTAGGLAGYYINGLSTYVTLTNNGTVAGRTN